MKKSSNKTKGDPDKELPELSQKNACKGHPRIYKKFDYEMDSFELTGPDAIVTILF